MTDQPGSAPDDAATAAPAPPVTTPGTLTFHCTQCGARLEYAPGTTSLKCPYCGHLQAVAAIDTVVEEHSFDAWAAVPPKPRAAVGSYRLGCHRCGPRAGRHHPPAHCPFSR